MASQKPWEKNWNSSAPQTQEAGTPAPTAKKPWEKDWSGSAPTPAPEATPPQAPANTPAAAATPTTETYNNGTGVTGAAVGTVEGVASGLGSAWNAITSLPGKAVDVGKEIWHQGETGTLTTPEFQKAPLTGNGGKLDQLASGLGLGVAETGKAVAQLPNEVLNTAVATGHAIAPETITRDTSQNPVDIYGRDTVGTDTALSQALQPQTEQGKQIASILPYTVEEGAQIPQVYAMSVKSLQDKGIPATSENVAQEFSHNLTLMGLTVGGMKAGGAAGNVVAGTGIAGKGARAEAMAPRFGEQAEDVYQGGNQAQQQAVKDVYTGEGTTGYKTAVDNSAGANGTRAQEALDRTVEEAHNQIKAKYNQHLGDAQAALDAKNVTGLTMKQTKSGIAEHLAADEKSGMLEDKTRKVLSKLQDRNFSNLAEINDAKLDLNTLRSWAYKNGHYKDYDVINDVSNKLKTEADATVKHFAPDAVPAWKEADKLHSSLADDFGKNSKASKIADSEKMTPEQAENAIAGNTMTARGNVDRLSNAFRDLRSNQGFVGGDELASNFGEAVGNTTRQRAHEMATEAARVAEQKVPGSGDAAYRKKFEDVLVNSDRQMRSIEGLGTQSQQGLNQAILDATNMLKPVDTEPSVLGKLYQKTVGKVPVVGDVLNMASDAATGKLRSMTEASKKKWLANATPEEIERMYQAQQRGAAAPAYSGLVAGEASYTPPVQPNTPAAAATPSSVPTVQPMPTAPATVQPEPTQHAQTAHKQEPELNHGTTTFYRAVSHAETGGEKNRFIFTKGHDKSTTAKSSAYGPAQLITTTARNFYKQHPDMFNEKERDYLDRFIEQGTRMLHSDDKDPTFGYGAPGVLGGAEDRKLYFQVVHKMMNYMIKKNGGSYEKTIREWRYGDPNADIDRRDPGYAKKVRSYFIQNL